MAEISPNGREVPSYGQFVGGVAILRFAEPQAPFGGMKGSSSHSREQGKSAVHFFTETKTVYITG